MRAGSADVFQIFLVAGRADRPETLLHHHFRKAHDGVQRRANLMRYAGQEIGLRRIGAFGGKTRRFQRAVIRRCMASQGSAETNTIGLPSAKILAQD